MEYRVQVLVLQSELNTAGPLTKVEYQSYDAYSDGRFYQFEMRLCHTPLSELTRNFANNYGGRTPALVGSANPYVINTAANAWFGVNCSPAFNYNNSDNLIVELHWRNTELGVKCEVWGWVGDRKRLLLGETYNATEGIASPKTDRLRLTFGNQAVAPTSLGRVRALFR